jgi:hypothetical protein
MAAVTTTQGVPLTIESGNEYHFTVNYPDFPVGTWTAAFVIVLSTGTPSSTAATTSGSDFLVTLTSAVTAALAPGDYTFAVYVTSSSQRTTAETGKISILPNLAVARTATFAESQVALLKTVMASFAATDKQTVNFNGQSFTRYAIADYQKQLVYFQAAVIREQQTQAALRGEVSGGRVALDFIAAD